MTTQERLSSLSPEEARTLAPAALRAAIRDGRWSDSTVGLAADHLQANLTVVPADMAFEFLLFCVRNAAACPVIDVGEPGVPAIRAVAESADLRTDIPRYRVYEDGGLVDEPRDLLDHWRDDAVAFLLGCAMTCDQALLDAGVPVRHLESGRKAPVYVTRVPCRSAGRFAGPLVVNMRPIPAALVSRTVQITSRYPVAHGAPVHIGDPAQLGIEDLTAVDFGEAPVLEAGDVPVFWGCGITPQLAVAQARPAYMLTHYPGHMFITDRRAEVDAAH